MMDLIKRNIVKMSDMKFDNLSLGDDAAGKPAEFQSELGDRRAQK